MVLQHSHHKGPLFYDVFRDVDSLQLHAPFDEKEKKRAEQRLFREGGGDAKREEHLAIRLRQCMVVVVGIAIALVTVLLKGGLEIISESRRHAVLLLLGGGQGASRIYAVFVSAGFTGVCALAASLLVAWEPAAASSGIPAVLAFLNGCDLQGGLSGRVLVAKVLGTAFAVGSGLAVGPEGPMVHIGASMGMLIVRRCIGPVLRSMGPTARRVEDELQRQPMKYHVQAAAMGAGAGIAAAFQAPFAGTLFVAEEAASYFSKRLFLNTMITCAVAVLTITGVNSVLGIERPAFYSSSSLCDRDQTLDSVQVVQVTVVGVICGALAVGFNAAVTRLAVQGALLGQRFRGQKRRLILRRVSAAMLVGILCGAVSAVLPFTLPCRDASLQNAISGTSGCIIDEWLPQFVSGSRSVLASQAVLTSLPRVEGPLVFAWKPAPGLFGAQFDPVKCPQALLVQPSCRLQGIEDYIPDGSTLLPEQYCCAYANLSALQNGTFDDVTRPAAPLKMNPQQWPQGSCPKGSGDPHTGTVIEKYSPSASLWLTGPDAIVRNLLTRGAPQILPWSDLVIFLVGYSTLTVLSAGAWLPGGLLVPTMIIGATVGRLCGIAFDAMWQSVLANRRAPIPWAPEVLPLVEFLSPGAAVDSVPGLPSEPGVMALAGCAAFLTGSSSLMLFVLVLLVEMTLTPFLIPVIVIAVLSARLTASLMGSKGLYHELINVQSLPFLSESAYWRQGHHVVADVLFEDERRARNFSAAQVQDAPTFAGFENWPSTEDRFAAPLVDGDILVTVRRHASRHEVQSALEYCLPGHSTPSIHGFPVVENSGQLCGLVLRDALMLLLSSNADGGALRQTERPTHPPGNPFHGSLGSGEPSAGVEKIMDTAPFVVQASTPLQHAHMLFTRCGLRHLVVVDSVHKPIGVLTRKSLMPWRTPWFDQERVHTDTFREAREAHSPALTPPSSPSMRPTWWTPHVTQERREALLPDVSGAVETQQQTPLHMRAGEPPAGGTTRMPLEPQTVPAFHQFANVPSVRNHPSEQGGSGDLELNWQLTRES